MANVQSTLPHKVKHSRLQYGSKPSHCEVQCESSSLSERLPANRHRKTQLYLPTEVHLPVKALPDKSRRTSLRRSHAIICPVPEIQAVAACPCTTLVCKNSRSGDRSKTLPRHFTNARSRCHLLIRRLAVNAVMFAALANSSFVILSSTPPGVSWPIVRARVTSTWAARSRTVWQAKLMWDATCQAT